MTQSGQNKAAASRIVIAALASALALGAGTGIARACAFDLFAPEPTLIDTVVGSERLVLARPAADGSGRFEPVEVLLGYAEGIELPGRAAPGQRARFATEPDTAMLFARSGYGDWQRIGPVRAAMRPVVTTALANRAAWSGAYHPGRRALIGGLQDSPDPAVTALVIAELDRMPYAMLREMDMRIPTRRLLAGLDAPDAERFRAIRVLLLGLVGDAAARDAVIAALEAGGDGAPGAYAAALIEIDGAGGVERLSRGLADAETGRLEQLVMAMAVQNGVAAPPVRQAVSAAIRDLVAARPEAGPIVARQFGARADWSQARALLPLLQARALPDAEDLRAIWVYVAQAGRDPGAASVDPRRDG